MKYPLHLRKLIESFRKLPGVGLKSAERYAFHLLNLSDKERFEFARLVDDVKLHLIDCPNCGSLTDASPCLLCIDQQRDAKTLCVVISQSQIFAFEQTGQFKGLYHVIGSLFSPLEGKVIKNKSIEKLKERIETQSVEEVILAIDATLEGDATALYIKDILSSFNIKISRIAFGLPQNCSLEFVDGSTLSYAIKGRSDFK
jgi:recombination protein RecR